MTGYRARTISLIALFALFQISGVAAAKSLAPPPRGFRYTDAPAMNRTVEDRLQPAMRLLTDRLVREKRGMTMDGTNIFASGDRFLPGKIAIALAYPLLEMKAGDPALEQRLTDYRAVMAMIAQDPNDSWGIYYSMLALHKLKQAGLLDRAIDPATLTVLKSKLDWRRFVRPDLTLIDLPNNYYGVAFSVARMRFLLGWEDESGSKALLARTLDHYRTYSGNYGFADETDGQGRFDRYSVLLVGEIAQRFIETGLEPPQEVRDWLRKSVDLMLPRLNLHGEGFEYGRSIGAYGDTAFLEVLSAAAKLKVLTAQETRMAYAFSTRVTARYMDFWYDPAMQSVNLWDAGRRTDAYRARHRMLGENFSLARQLLYTNAIWNDLGYRDAAPDPGFATWLDTLPRATLTWFARGDHDRALVTIRDGERVIGLPLIGGGKEFHNKNAYFPIPFSPGLLAGVADTSWPSMIPRFDLADGSRLMPTVNYKDIAMQRAGQRTIIRYRQDALDRVNGEAPAPDARLRVSTEYIFSPGRITRRDRYVPTQPLDLSGAAIAFARFAGDGIRGVKVKGMARCAMRDVSAQADYRTPVGQMAQVLECERGAGRLDKPFNVEWTITYDRTDSSSSRGVRQRSTAD